jgi:hypothetical protein
MSSEMPFPGRPVCRFPIQLLRNIEAGVPIPFDLTRSLQANIAMVQMTEKLQLLVEFKFFIKEQADLFEIAYHRDLRRRLSSGFVTSKAQLL